MSRAKVQQFSYSAHHATIAVISISDCDKEFPNLRNNPGNGIVYQVEFHFAMIVERHYKTTSCSYTHCPQSYTQYIV